MKLQQEYSLLLIDDESDRIDSIINLLHNVSFHFNISCFLLSDNIDDNILKQSFDIILLNSRLADLFNDKEIADVFIHNLYIPVILFNAEVGNYESPDISLNYKHEIIHYPFTFNEFINQLRLMRKLSENQKLIEIQKKLLDNRDKKIAELSDKLIQKNKEIEYTSNELIIAFKKFKTLNKIGKHIISEIELKDIFTILYQKLNKLMDAQILQIGKINLRNSQMIDFWEYNLKTNEIYFKEIQINDHNRLSAKCIRDGKLLYIENFDVEAPNHVNDINVYYVDGNLPQSAVYIPLVLSKTIIGVFIIKNYHKHAFSELQINILKNIAIYISVALNNAEVFHTLKIQNDNINSSLKYGLTIQKAVLPKINSLEKYFKTFILYRPKDIVSGDFYWFSDKLPGNRTVIVVGDCTGHGVPGAFMTMIANMLLNDIVNEKKIITPSKILDFLDSQIKVTLEQTDNNNNDGMDISLCLFEKISGTQTKVTFCGAKNDLFYYSNEKSTIIRIKADRKSIGGGQKKRSNIEFKDHEFIINKADVIYFLTDGIIDQNCIKRNRFGSTRLIQLLEQTAKLPIEEQQSIIEQNIDNFREGDEQRDDIALIGLVMK